MADRLAEITEKQRRILELVGQGCTSKEIGRALGLSDQTVDTYLKRAMRSLGASSRIKAAIIFAQISATYDIPNLGTQPAAVEFAATLQPFALATETIGTEADGPIENMVHEERAVFDLIEAPRPPIIPTLFPTREKPQNDVGTFTKIIQILTVMLLLAGATAAVLGNLAGIDRLVRSF